ncbi:MAG: nucleoside hydrolase [Candidatus Caccosoma sp.]|nr:nucleoside hydrolase [Candidatus Caccosoma sp.]
MNNVIIDTDIGDDIDDIYALVLALKLNIDIKLIMVTTNNTKYKATLVAKILTLLDKTNIPIFIGKENDCKLKAQDRWINNFSLDDYKGKIITSYKEINDLLIENNYLYFGFGPMVELSNLLDIYPNIKNKIKVIAMGGAINRGYINQSEADVEYNVIMGIKEYENIIKNVDFTLVPLDVCRDIIIKKPLYLKLRESNNIACKLIMENYKVWLDDYVGGAIKFDINESTSILYDLAPLMYYLNESNYKKEEIYIAIDNKGKMIQGNIKIKALLDVKNQEEMLKQVVNYYNS